MKQKSEIIIYEVEDGLTKIDVKLEDNTVWLTQSQIAILFDKGRSTIAEHISNIFKDSELDEKSNVGFSDIANSDKPVKIYNLDVIISVGYRVKTLWCLLYLMVNILQEKKHTLQKII